MMQKTPIIETIKDNIAAFLFGYIVASGTWPILWDQLTNL